MQIASLALRVARKNFAHISSATMILYFGNSDAPTRLKTSRLRWSVSGKALSERFVELTTLEFGPVQSYVFL